MAQTLKNRTGLRVKREVVARIPTKDGVFQLALYSDNKENKENLAIIYGSLEDLASASDVYVRVHSECLTGEVLGSLRCDCGEQLSTAMYNIAQKGLGVVVFLRQEGRGIGLGEKLKAYNLQDQGHDTVEANLMLGHKADARSFEHGALILEDLNVKKVRLLTNNPLKIESLRNYGIDILDRIPMLPKQISVDTLNYLKTKVDRMRHGIQLDSLSINTVSERPESCPVSPPQPDSPNGDGPKDVQTNGHKNCINDTDTTHEQQRQHALDNMVASSGIDVMQMRKMRLSASNDNVRSLASKEGGVSRSSVPAIVSDYLPSDAYNVSAYTVFGRPYVTITYAQSLNGCIATREKKPLSISCKESMVMTHQLRADHDAILVGIGTVCADNPRLTVRLSDGEDPLPIILDTNLRVPTESRLLKNTRKPWIVCAEGCDKQKVQLLENMGVTVISVKTPSGEKVNVGKVLEILKQRGIKSLMVEGGASVINSFLSSRLVDFVVVTVAPVFVNGLEVLNSPVNIKLPKLESPVTYQLGTDAIISGRPIWED
eukprot:CFRG2063T1